MIRPLPPSMISTMKISRTRVASVLKYFAKPPHTPAIFLLLTDRVSRRWERCGVLVMCFSVFDRRRPCILTLRDRDRLFDTWVQCLFDTSFLDTVTAEKTDCEH